MTMKMRLLLGNSSSPKILSSASFVDFFSPFFFLPFLLPFLVNSGSEAEVIEFSFGGTVRISEADSKALAAEPAKKSPGDKFKDVSVSPEPPKPQTKSPVEEKQPVAEKPAAEKQHEKRPSFERPLDKAPITDPFYIGIIKPSLTKLKLELGPDSPTLNNLIASLEDFERENPKNMKDFVSDVIQGVAKSKDKDARALLPSSARTMTLVPASQPSKASKTSEFLYNRWRTRTNKDTYFLG